MARKRTRIPLNVFLNGRLVGCLRRQTSGAIDFHYDSSWLSWEHAFPLSLSLPLREDRYIGGPVIAVFDNLLPDDDTIRHRLAERTKASGYDAYSLLAAVGRDCAVARDQGIPLIRLSPVEDAAAGDFTLHRGDSPTGRARANAAFSGPDDEALVLHTSGTTSRPKLVPLLNRNLAGCYDSVTP